MSRLEKLSFKSMTTDQQAVAGDVAASRGGIFGPFLPWVRNPQLGDCNQKLGAYCLFWQTAADKYSNHAGYN